MKIIHLADLHIGKRLKEFSLIEDQKYILAKIISIVDNENPDAVVIAGDIYDKSVPSAEAVEVFDDFLSKLSERGKQTFVISGNHDSAERIAFGSSIMGKSGIHMSPVYNGEITPLTFEDEYGSVNIFMLPFLKPGNVRRYFPDEEIKNYNDAIKVAVDNMNVDTEKRNILVTHQFVAGAEICESEDILTVGGTEQVAYTVFDKFDYVALGHIHGPQNIGREAVRYSGTPLKYSFSECKHKKSVTVVEMLEKGNVKIDEIPLVPKRDMVEIKGSFDEVMSEDFYSKYNTEDYFHITLTDDDIPDVIARLRKVYKNVMKLSYDNRRTQSQDFVGSAEDIERKSELTLFAELFEKQNGAPLTQEQTDLVAKLIEELKEGE